MLLTLMGLRPIQGESTSQAWERPVTKVYQPITPIECMHCKLNLLFYSNAQFSITRSYFYSFLTTKILILNVISD